MLILTVARCASEYAAVELGALVLLFTRLTFRLRVALFSRLTSRDPRALEVKEDVWE